jgi:NDP-sugar pyrophosphorylase family protein
VEHLADYEGANVWVGAGTRIEEGVEFHGDVVLGAGCHVGRGATIERTVCWDRVDIPQGTRLESSVITEGVRLRPKMELTDRLVMRVAGDDSELRKREIRDELLIATLRSEATRGL